MNYTKSEIHWAEEIAYQAIANEELLDHLTSAELIHQMAAELGGLLQGQIPPFTQKIIDLALERFRDPSFSA